MQNACLLAPACKHCGISAACACSQRLETKAKPLTTRCILFAVCACTAGLRLYPHNHRPHPCCRRLCDATKSGSNSTHPEAVLVAALQASVCHAYGMHRSCAGAGLLFGVMVSGIAHAHRRHALCLGHVERFFPLSCMKGASCLVGVFLLQPSGCLGLEACVREYAEAGAAAHAEVMRPIPFLQCLCWTLARFVSVCLLE